MDVNEERLAFYSNLGLTITQWAHVEHALYELLAAIDRRQRHRAFFWVLSQRGEFRKQLQLVGESVQERVTDTAHLRDWKKLRKRLENGYLKRNALAHRVVMNYAGPPGRRIALIKWPVTVMERAPSDAICVRNLVGIRYEFSALFRTVGNLARVMRGLKELYPEQLERSGAMPTLAAVRAELEAQGRVAGKPALKASARHG